MLRPKLTDMAREAKKIKAAPLKAAAAASKDRQRMPHYRVLESPACRRVVLRGPSGRLDGRAAESLMMMLRAWENNYLVKAVMLQGGPRTDVFSVGWERGKDGKQPPAEREHALQRFSQLSYLLATLSKPTVAWLNGEVRGSGLGLALARCRVATKSSSFRVGAAKRGWALDGGVSFALPRLRAGEDPAVAGGPAALAMARYLTLTGAPLSGADMLACGMATHLMDDATAAMLPKRLADLTYEPDHVVEDALSEHATLFYKTDSRMNPSPYRDLWVDWAANDEARERMIRMAASNGGGPVGGGWADLEEDGDEEEASAQEAEEDPFKGWTEEAEGEGVGLSVQQQQEETRQAWEHEMVAEGPMAVRLKSKQLLFRQGLLEEDEDGGMGGGRGGMRGQQGQQGLSKAAQREARAETEGSLWWHRNFAPGDEALVRAQIEAAESEIAEDVLSEGMQAALAAAGKFTDGRFPEYFTYPERRLLVEGDRLLLSPWDCSVDRSELFPEFVELSVQVQRCFGGGSLEEVVDALKVDGSAWAQECLKHMDEASPLSLRLAFQQLEASTAAEIEECFRAEYRVGARLLKQQRQQQQQNGGALGRLAEVPVAQAEEMVCRPLEGEEGQELFLPERVAGEVRAKSASAVERRFARTATTKGGI